MVNGIRLLLISAAATLCMQASAASLFDTTNLEHFGIPDVLAPEHRPYDSRIYEVGERIRGIRCCQRDMYEIEGKKIVLLSHRGEFFLAIIIAQGDTKMYFAEKPGIFTEYPVEKGGSWDIPDWIKSL